MRTNRRSIQNAQSCIADIAKNKVKEKEQSYAYTWMMLRKWLPVRERFDNLRMDYIDKTNLIGEQRYSDQLTYDGT